MKKFFMIFLLTISINAFSQGEPEDGDGLTAPGEEIPVDGGLSLLLAAGAAYGGRKLHIAARRKR